jgi:16S rRNA (guanine527-N7)-methyltransferase
MLPAFEIAETLFSGMNLHVSRETYQNMENYATFLVDYNEKVNLTAITDGEGILKKHFIDSLLLGRFCENELTQGAKLLDIGSGAGFPGVPLALMRGDLDITLLDSLNKRITFLNLLREQLGLHYAAVHGRAEELAKNPDYRECFDIVTARAVAALPTLAEYSLPFVKVGGFWLAMKGPGEELKPALQAIRVLGGEFVRTEEYKLPDGEERVIYVVKKITPTATKFPRNSGQIKSKPL